MPWLGTALTLLAGIVALLLVILVKRRVDVDELGSVSHRWLAQHRSQ